MRKSEGFERFYFRKVGLGEGCGCAERVIDVHEFDQARHRSKRRRPWSGIVSLARRFGLLARPQ